MQKEKKKNEITNEVSDERITIDVKEFFKYVQRRKSEEQSAIPRKNN